MRLREECLQVELPWPRTWAPCLHCCERRRVLDTPARGRERGNGMFLLEEVFLEGKHGDGRKLMCLWISVVIKWSVLVRIAGWESNTKESWG